MIRIAIVEDDTGYRSQLGKYIEQYQSDFRKRSVYRNFQTDWKLSKI